MSTDREVVAAVGGESPATASALVATTDELSTAIPATGTHVLTVCANCGATVSGHYCASCGQRVGHAVHSLWHFLSEVAEDLTHADSRLWRTLSALLFKPGCLTNEFIAGRRMKYLPPFRLYLVLSLPFFLIVTFSNLRHTAPAEVQNATLTAEDKRELSIISDDLPVLPGESLQQHRERLCDNLQYGGPWRASIESTLRASCQSYVKDNGHSLQEAFLHNLPRALFLLLPILALVMKPLYLRPPRYFVEHLLFLLHNHAFVFVVLGLFTVAGLLIPSAAVIRNLAIAVGLYIPYYYYRGMRRVYGQGAARTLGKLAVLSFAYLVTAGIVLAATAIYSVLVQ